MAWEVIEKEGSGSKLWPTARFQCQSRQLFLSQALRKMFPTGAIILSGDPETGRLQLLPTTRDDVRARVINDASMPYVRGAGIQKYIKGQATSIQFVVDHRDESSGAVILKVAQ